MDNDYGSTGYGYDGDGLRTNKTGVGATTFTWNIAEGLPLVIQDGATSFISGPGGLPLEQIGASGEVSFFHQDQLGSTRMLSDATGMVAARFDYDPYGNPTSTSGPATTPLRFAGEYRDAESGLYYLRARYYHPQTAQFLSRDPIESLTRKPYSYAASSPLNFIDPSGLAECKGTEQSQRRKCQPSTSAAAQAVLPTPSVGSTKLQNIVKDLYKGTINPGRIGTGTTADALRYELSTGHRVFGKSHLQKARDSLRGLENWLKANPNSPYHDRLVARSLADDLLDALGCAS